ncbi:hypothetical protein BKA70DRAFT_114278 [Coprinopsis sp. MPI-PUGE-AT-0042]|nr:hypothetical protein BKA70DRAFT_114278 [Coprinopsis sp. MPI-PUGE-AT-0042]
MTAFLRFPLLFDHYLCSTLRYDFGIPNGACVCFSGAQLVSDSPDRESASKTNPEAKLFRCTFFSLLSIHSLSPSVMQNIFSDLELTLFVSLTKQLSKNWALERRLSALQAGGSNANDTQGNDNSEMEGDLEGILEMMRSRRDVDEPVTPTSQSPQEDLNRQGIVSSNALCLKKQADYQNRIDAGDALGTGGLWSADMFFEHLKFLENHVPPTNEDAAHLWINAFLYRVAAMGEEDKVIVKLERDPAARALDQDLSTGAGSYAHWTVMTMSPCDANEWLDTGVPQPIIKPGASTLSVSEGPLRRLGTQLPQAIFEMVDCAKKAEKSTIRGVLTNGREWMFLILNLDEDGGRYIYSCKVFTYAGGITHDLSRKGVSAVVAILAHWAKNSHEDYNPATDPFFDVYVLP